VKNIIFLAIICALSLTAVAGYASDYQGEENRGSVFQVLGDLITGNYKVDGKPIKEKGWFQLSADETKKLKLSESEDATDATKPAKP
jgi:hypothetical protein